MKYKLLSDYYKDWPKSGEYVNDLKLVKKRVIEYLKNFTKKNAVAIFDLDDTVFYTDPLKIHNVEALSEKYHRLVYPANKEIVDIVNYCNDNSIKIIFITARPPDSEESSIFNIKLLGMKYYKLYHNPEYPDSKFKIKLKQDLAKKYSVILSIGDNWNDLKGLKKCLCIKLPSPDKPDVYFSYDNEKYHKLE